MSEHPYKGLPAHQRWSHGMARPEPSAVDPVVSMPFRIGADQKVATAGSCFAQHIGARLEAAGLDVLMTETAHPLLPPETAKAFGYGIYSARFGNIYTARQLLQLLRRAFGRFAPKEPAWQDTHGRWFDPFRPAVQPDGFATRREHDADRAQHLAAVRRMFETANVLVFTLGLTECWVSREDGAVFPVCPGVAAGAFDADRYVFRNFGVAEVTADLRAFLDEVRQVNPGLKLILTVSPVPLAATAEPRHVWTSTTWSKAVLRVAAESLVDGQTVAYFPSYEIVTSPAARGAYFEADLRSVTSAGVDHVMELFFKHGVVTDQRPRRVHAPRDSGHSEALAKAVAVMCEEAMLDPATRSGRSPEETPMSAAAAGRESRRPRRPEPSRTKPSMIKIAASRSQHGEDEVIASLIPDDCEKVFVDVGANDGYSWSNSYNFAQVGFRLLLIEPMPVYAGRCAVNHRDNPNVFIEPYAISRELGTATFYVNLDAASDLLAMRSSLLREAVPGDAVTEVTVPTAPLSFLLAKHKVPERYAVLSVDAEGMDLQVLETADLDNHRPQVICVENGLDAAPIRAFLETKGYRLATKLGEVNDIFVDARPPAAPRSSLWNRLVGRGA